MLWLLYLMSLVTQGLTQYPQNEYEYSVRRDWLKQSEAALAGARPQLNQNEQTVDRYLQYLKWQEFQATKDNGFRPSRPIEEEMANIMNSEVFKTLRPLPKGGIMHTHESMYETTVSRGRSKRGVQKDHELSKETQLRLIYDSDQFQHLFIVRNTSTIAPWTLDFFHNPPVDDQWVRVNESGYTFEEILSKQTFMAIINDHAKQYPTDSGQRWDQMNPLWGRGSTQLIANVHIKRLYIEALYNQSMGEGVQYIESRKNFGPPEMLYEIDTSGASDATNGKKLLDNRDGELEIEITKEIIREYKIKNPSFIGHRRIIYSSRFMATYDEIKTDMDRAIRLRDTFPEDIIGYDLVAEEDNGNSHLFYLRNFLDLYTEGSSRIPLYMHTAETNWPGDLITAVDDNDPVATLENIYDALLLGVRRVGHGLGFFKHPSLLEDLKKQGIAIEVCPVSNQLLGFYPDLRVHPAINYYRSGVPIVLGPDDPGTFGYNYFSIDWYEIFMAWGLTLADLKQLAINSISFSSMNSNEKQDAMDNYWGPAWNAYIDDVKTKACTGDFTANQPYFARILPTAGARAGPTDVHVYGRHFERAICKEIICMFGDLPATKITYIANFHIICQAPDVAVVKARVNDLRMFPIELYEKYQIRENEIVVSVTIDLGDGVSQNLGNFTYMYDPYTTLAPTVPAGGAIQFQSSEFLILCTITILLLFFKCS